MCFFFAKSAASPRGTAGRVCRGDNDAARRLGGHVPRCGGPPRPAPVRQPCGGGVGGQGGLGCLELLCGPHQCKPGNNFKNYSRQKDWYGTIISLLNFFTGVGLLCLLSHSLEMEHNGQCTSVKVHMVFMVVICSRRITTARASCPVVSEPHSRGFRLLPALKEQKSAGKGLA